MLCCQSGAGFHVQSDQTFNPLTLLNHVCKDALDITIKIRWRDSVLSSPAFVRLCGDGGVEPHLIAQMATQMQQIAGVNAGPLWLWLLATALVLTVAANLRDSDKVNDGKPDSCHLPPWVQIYGTSEVETDKLASRWETRALTWMSHLKSPPLLVPLETKKTDELTWTPQRFSPDSKLNKILQKLSKRTDE